jgi:hypothetical protein
MASGKPKKKRPELVFTTKYDVARVITTRLRGPDGTWRYTTIIRFEGDDYAHIETGTRADAIDAHDVMGGYCNGIDENMAAHVARARATVLAETRALLIGRPVMHAAEVEETRAHKRRAKMIRRNKRKR